MSSSHWVFLRGLVRQHRHWESFPTHFQSAFPNAILHVVDLPGNGDLYKSSSPTSVHAMVDALREQLRTRQVSGPVNVLALSLGGMVAIDWMHHYPDDVKNAVLINTSLRRFSRFTERLRPQNYLNILKSLLNNDREYRERLILDITTNLYPDKASLVKKWTDYANKQPTSRLNGLRQLWAAARFQSPEESPKTFSAENPDRGKVLVLCGEADRLVNSICSTQLANAYGWPLRSHPQAGHDLTLDDNAWVIAQIKDFFGR